MKLMCAACENRPVFIVSEKQRSFGSSRGVGAHDLCDRCHRALRDKIVAARQGPKPFWAVRNPLQLMEEQAWAKRQDVERR